MITYVLLVVGAILFTFFSLGLVARNHRLELEKHTFREIALLALDHTECQNLKALRREVSSRLELTVPRTSYTLRLELTRNSEVTLPNPAEFDS